MDRRIALMVQCPEVATTKTYTNTAITTAALIAAANPLRKSLMIENGSPTASAALPIVGTVQADVAAKQGILIGPSPNFATPIEGLQVDEKWGEWSQKAWYAISGFSAGPIAVLTYEEIWQCQSIILGVNTSQLATDGVTPAGVWQSPDLSSGGSQFRLNRNDDGDLVIQEWFAYPVGTGNITVQVFQSFDDLPTVVDGSTGFFDVMLPRLSQSGQHHLDNLLSKLKVAQ